jgi:hypothetical protein
MANFAVPAPLQADNSDVPLMVNTEPELQQTVFDSFSINSDSLVIEAYGDANGRIQDYQILSDPNDSKALLSQVKQMLIFISLRSEPAMSMGRPSSGRAVPSFSKISVRG